MIERHRDIYIPTCDGCGAELPEEYDWQDAKKRHEARPLDVHAAENTGRQKGALLPRVRFVLCV